MANTRARQPDETLVACVEEARKDALEVAQEADAPPQARAEDASTLTHWRLLPNGENERLAFHSPRRRWAIVMADESIIGRYARVVIDWGTEPLRKGLTLACRVTGLATPLASVRQSAIRGEVVSNDVDGPLPSELLQGSLIITPEDPDVSEARILEGGSFRARLGLLTLAGDLVATGEGALVRISGEIPYERACPDCLGWKICEDCAGTGGESGVPCLYCEGTGQCNRCEGSGSVTEVNDSLG